MASNPELLKLGGPEEGPDWILKCFYVTFTDIRTEARSCFFSASGRNEPSQRHRVARLHPLRHKRGHVGGVLLGRDGHVALDDDSVRSAKYHDI